MALIHGDPSDALELTTVVLQGLAGGTLMYVAFFEVNHIQKANKHKAVEYVLIRHYKKKIVIRSWSVNDQNRLLN